MARFKVSTYQLDKVVNMARLLITLLLAFIPLANAGVGDVYYCVPDRADVIDAGMGHREVKFGKFTMKWLEGKIIMKGSTLEFSQPILFSTQETFTAGKTEFQRMEHWTFKDGRFQQVTSRNDTRSYVLIFNATCEKFD